MACSVTLFLRLLETNDCRTFNQEESYEKGENDPYRGIETITYMLTGDVTHGDRLGNKGAISSNDTQWVTAGSGTIH
jgi:quercetin 2,3-dioxygenase